MFCCGVRYFLVNRETNLARYHANKKLKQREQKCRVCKLVVTPTTISLFVKARGKKNGISTICKPCNRGPFNVASKNYHEKRMIFYEVLKNSPCLDCGLYFPPRLMEFDHVRGTKKFNVSVGFLSHYPLSTVLEEVQKCDLLCANCHRLRTIHKHKKRQFTEISAVAYAGWSAGLL